MAEMGWSMKAVTPFERGMSAARRGKRLRDNPYTHVTTRQSANFWEWQRGYVAQAKEEAAAAVTLARNTKE